MQAIDTSSPPSRGHKKRARTRRQLITAAVDVIAERGEAFAVSDVTSRAGMANGTFYNYFADRDELIAAIVPEIMGSFAEASAMAVTEADPAIRFATITTFALARAAVAPDEMRVMLRLDAAQQAIVDDGPLRYLRADLADGFETGRFAVQPSEAVLDVVVGTLLMAVRRIVNHDPGTEYREQVVGQLLRSLGLAPSEANVIAEAVG